MNMSNFMGLFTGFDLAGIVGAVLFFVFKEELTAYVKSWIFHIFISGEYNFDGNRGTYDWCESFNLGNGEWFLRKISSYSLPFPLGKNCIKTEVKDENGEYHEQDIPTLDWLAKRSARRKVSAEQAARIKDAGNEWPKEAQVNNDNGVLVPLVTDLVEQLRNSATSFNSVGSRISSLNSTLKKKNP